MKNKTTAIWKKSEFWMTAVTSVSGLLLAFGVITPAQSSAIASVAPQIIGALLALFSTAKFVSVQHSAKIEVFRAMCALHVDSHGKAKAQDVKTPEEQVSELARAAGL